MRRFLPLLLLALLTPSLPAGSASAQEWRPAPERDVLLTNNDISPRDLHLKAGQPVRLRFVNDTNQAMSFAARDFFRSAQFRERDSDTVNHGVIDVPPLSERVIMLIPKAGRFTGRSHNLIRRLLGKSCRIIVE
jgi:hypothetical protein